MVLGQVGIWLSLVANFFFFQASLICDKTALKALIAFFHSCEGDHMIDVLRREIICLDSQIEKINHLKPTFNVIMGRFQTVLSEGIHLSPSLSLSRGLSLSAAPECAGPAYFLVTVAVSM